jgi:hypothetical protein
MAFRYAALTSFLTTARERTGQVEFELTFAEISTLVGSLPSAAYVRPQWWHNYQTILQEAGWQLQTVSVSKQRVSFIRAGGAAPARPESETTLGQRRLRQFFQALPPEQIQAVLTVEEFGRLRGQDLYGNGQDNRERWANSSDRPWMQAGWEMQGIYARSRLMVFRRQGSDVTHAITHFLRHILERKRLKGPRPTARDLLTWLRVCGQLEWNFEGVTLYEQGHIDLTPLEAAEQAELEQAYALCKRRLAYAEEEQPNPPGPH